MSHILGYHQEVSREIWWVREHSLCGLDCPIAWDYRWEKDMEESQLGTNMALYLLPGKKHIPFLTKAEPELWARNKPFIP